MYVSFGESVDDVTFRLSLRHLFCPRLKKKLWSITISLITGFMEKTDKVESHRNHIISENLMYSHWFKIKIITKCP